ARELARKPVPFVILEQNETKAARFANDWLMLVGDATQEQTLRQVHIERARGLVAATTTDATNLYIVLTARGLNPQLTIIARASEEGAEKHLLKAGADSVVSPYHFAGQRIAQTFLRPHVVSFLDTAPTLAWISKSARFWSGPLQNLPAKPWAVRAYARSEG